MPITFACPHCHRSFEVPERFAGKQARCKTCRRVVTVPKLKSEVLELSDEHVVKPEEPVDAPVLAGLEPLKPTAPAGQGGQPLAGAMDGQRPTPAASESSGSTFYVWLSVGCVGAALVMFGSLVVYSLVTNRQMREAEETVAPPAVPPAPSRPFVQPPSAHVQEQPSAPSSPPPAIHDKVPPPTPLLTKVPGTRVSLVKPEGFSLAGEFSGFEQKETNSSIVVVELSAPYRQVAAEFSDAQKMSRQGMQLLLQETVVVDGNRAANLYQLQQTVQGTTFLKWVVAFGDDTHVVLINAMCPAVRKASLASPLRQAALSVKYDAEATETVTPNN